MDRDVQGLSATKSEQNDSVDNRAWAFASGWKSQITTQPVDGHQTQ